MKHLIVSCLILCFGTSLLAQGQDPIQSFYKKYRKVEDATHLNIGGLLLDIATTFSEEEDAKALLARVHRLRVLTVPGADVVATEDLLSLRQQVLGSGFEELIMVRDGDSLVNIYLQENEEAIIEQLFIMVEGADEVTLVNLSGSLRYEDLRHLDLGGPGGAALQTAAVP
jgi:hypothetical protein